ncbi:HTH-type transcriptional regulator / antitoxin HigA [Vibrio crassostreae]|uniref:XRE family transcriptional regulator n=1 Tax=Vibrio TaxID=662 RepID=UPI001BD518B0|nr:XRE family transcriptional regulator [Vibrio crassostreae]CAK1861384.1 HTH-type transcriptional regulator / antitoxin HigA [Vibrio crassostreae]CAK1869213.1 HTH-type transcriptional regulator / antitoxin HigA [Vibrio crassostreae]CAK2388444.1 HTH-type transcriptional regulator / antitoxin HigA [Vibrio crassostreae]CAK2698325.1 HTH-type transcriptional regulator / antitoxin HigA [Vibrio crassostreae]CAK2726705.1 HTH-type transcriptional regulator / antitoxin HigA [Vibrio crassostreae]
MIKNSRQLALTKNQVQEFNTTIHALEEGKSDTHPLLMQAQKNALIFQRDDLLKEIEEYEQLLSGEFAVFDVDNIADLPKALIRSRIYLGLTQKDLAEKLGMKEQQIQRYENTEYSSASFSTIVSIIRALDLKITEDVFLPKASRTKNLLLAKLSDAGLEESFIEKRIAPREIHNFDRDSWVERVCEKVSTIFGWTKEQLLGDEPLSIGRDGALVARFKMPAGANEQYASAYTQYAYTVAKLAIRYFNKPKEVLNEDAEIIRNEIIGKYGDVSFESLLSHAYDKGVIVLGLNDSGAFHGATWRISHRNIVVLKQKTLHTSRWSFDLLHELYHASQRPELSEFSLIELSETSDERRLDQEEIEANKFASQVLLGMEAENYVNMCFASANGNLAWLKNAVIQIAEQYDLDCGVLANQVANKHDIMERKVGRKSTWWGTAHNLQQKNCDPREVCNSKLKEHISIEDMDEFDREFFEQAICR